MKSLKIMVGCPSYKQPDIMCTLKLAKALLEFQRVHPAITVDLYSTEKILIHNARKNITNIAYKGHYDYLIWFDDDQVLRPKTLVNLFKHKKHAITALTFSRTPPYFPIAFVRHKDNTIHQLAGSSNRGLVEIYAAGLGCTIVSKEIINITFDKDLLNTDTVQGEDMAYWKLVREAGYKIWVDTDEVIGHCVNTRYVVDETTVDKLRRLKQS